LACIYPLPTQLDCTSQLCAQAVVGSLCPIHTTEATPGDPLYGDALNE
jgi:hypothetical protein